MKTTLKIFVLIFSFIGLSNTKIFAQGYKFTGKNVSVSKDVSRFHSASYFSPTTTFRSVGTPEWLIAKGVVTKKNWTRTVDIGNIKSNYPWWSISKPIARFNRQ
jgi:hypothetical protein